uniref:A2M domain-containing protein n=1 Tax=Anisakis simplex TaxID=6269 RepID=A0A0M3JD87_ANISI
LSSNRLEQGTLAWARIDGLADDETPFAFGGAKYPLRVKWTLGTHTVLQIISAFQTSTAIRTSVQNQFEVLLSAREPGQVQLRVAVEIEPNAKLHFYRGARLYEDRATVVVVEGTQLLQPAIQPRSIRITPNAQIQLKPNRADGTFALRVPQQFASQLTIGGDSNAVLKAFSIGDAVVELQHISIPHNESTFIPISVCIIDF